MDKPKLKEVQYHPLTCQISSSHCCSWSEDNSLASLTKSGILIVDFSLNSFTISSNIPTKLSVVEPCSALPTNQFHDQIEDMIPKLHREELHLMILDKNLFPNFNGAEKFVPICKQFAWSPRGLGYLHRCLLAVVTNAGSCDIYVRGALGFVLHKSISEEWVYVCSKQWSDCNVYDFADLRTKVQKINIGVIEWSHAVGNYTEKTALLLCAHENFEISVWRVETMTYNVKPLENIYLDSLKPELSSDIKYMKWTQISDIRSILFISCLDGTVHALELEHDQLLHSCRLKSCFTVWDSADRILVSKIITLRSPNATDDILSVILAKGFYLVVLSLRLNGNVPAQPVLSHKFPAQVTGLESITSSQLLCVLWNGASHIITINPGSLNIDSVNKDITYTNYSCQGLTLSPNKVFAVLFNSVSRSYDHFVLRQPAHFYVMTLPKQMVNPILKIEAALVSSSTTASTIADCLAALRFSVASREQSIPENLMSQWTSFSSQSQSLQIYLCLTHILKETDTLEADKWMKLFDLIKTALYAQFFTRRKIFNPVTTQWLQTAPSILGNSFPELTAACKQYLEHVEIQDQAVCPLCSSDVKDIFTDHFVCSSNHKVPICNLTFQPCLTVPYCICDGCGVIALQEAVSSILERCVLCDGNFQLDHNTLDPSIAVEDEDDDEYDDDADDDNAEAESKPKKRKGPEIVFVKMEAVDETED